MKRLFQHIAFALIFALPCALFAADAPLLPGSGDQQLIQLINDARKQPLKVAESYGKAKAQVIKDFPELEGLLKEGLPPVSTHQALLGSALEHTRDMLENVYYAKASQDGSTPLDRMEAKGYIAADGEELLGMLAFRNYMDEAKAVQLIFKTMFLDELNPAWTGRRCILDPAFTDVGVSVKVGQRIINKETTNIYMVVCDFGATAVSDVEATLMILINQARRYPFLLADALGIDRSEALIAVPYLSEYTVAGIPPVRIDKNLYWTANTHAWEMMDMDYLSSISSDGLTPKERILLSGYPAQTAGEVVRPLSTTNPVGAETAVGINFERLLERELNPENTVNRKILNPVFSDAGPGVISSVPEAEPEDEDAGLFDKYHVNLLVCDFASRTPKNQTAGVYGWAYYDQNLNGLFDPEEGMARVDIKIRNKDGKLLLNSLTDNAGGFGADLTSGEYLIVVDDGTVKSGRWVTVNENLVSVPVRVVPETE